MSTKHFLQLIIFLTCSYSFAQLGVGTANPSTSAQLDVVSSNKGILIPRVALTSITDSSTIIDGNTESLMVYNTNTSAGLAPGYYYWANNVWNRLAVQSDITSLPQDVTSTDGSITGVAPNSALVAMDLKVKVDGSTIEVDAANGVQVRDNGIVKAKVADNAVDIDKIGTNGAGDANKVMGTGATGDPQWQDAAALATSLGEDVTSTDGSITGVSSNATLTTMDLEVNVDGTTIEVDATNGVQVRDNGIVTSKIANNAVDGTKIQVIGEVEGAMLYNNGTDWVSLPNGTAGQLLTMNVAGTAPEWTTPVTARIGEFVYGKSGKTVTDGYLAVSPGTIANGAVDYPLWAAQYPEFISGNDIVFPANVAGMFLRNNGGNAIAEGSSQNYRTARPTVANFTTNSAGNHSHGYSGSNGDTGDAGPYIITDNQEHNGTRYTHGAGAHAHTITGGGDIETNPINRAYQLYTIVDTYSEF